MCGMVGRLHQLVYRSSALFFLFEHAIICVRPTHPSFDFFLLPRLQEKQKKITVKDKVLLLPPLIFYLVYALYLHLHSEQSLNLLFLSFHRAFNQHPTFTAKQTYTHIIPHHMTHPFSLTLYFCISDWCFVLFWVRRDPLAPGLIQSIHQYINQTCFSISVTDWGFDSISLTHSLMSFCEWGLSREQKIANKQNQSVIANREIFHHKRCCRCGWITMRRTYPSVYLSVLFCSVLSWFLASDTYIHTYIQ